MYTKYAVMPVGCCCSDVHCQPSQYVLRTPTSGAHWQRAPAGGPLPPHALSAQKHNAYMAFGPRCMTSQHRCKHILVHGLLPRTRPRPRREASMHIFWVACRRASAAVCFLPSVVSRPEPGIPQSTGTAFHPPTPPASTPHIHPKSYHAYTPVALYKVASQTDPRRGASVPFNQGRWH
ncbi:hypothetical protein PLICRDRAFT_630805 [Plicaturopsis crispa FD-325 SS-3]|nr:hypothetical protein PLICRDRAFT_630805 [Plicaturopsis crispa FD-325 SS-3]